MLNVVLGLINLKLNRHYRLNQEIRSVGNGNDLLVAYLVERVTLCLNFHYALEHLKFGVKILRSLQDREHQIAGSDKVLCLPVCCEI